MRHLFEKALCLLLCVVIAAGLLAGCVRNAPAQEEQETLPAEGTAAVTEATEPVESTAPAAETESDEATEPAASEGPTAAATEPSTEPTSAPEGFVAYLETVYLADLPIFSGPSYDDSYSGIVEEAGVYTIVEEAWDNEGNLWGRLKSGAGWINLTDSRLAAQARVPVSAGFATQRLLDSGNYDQCIHDESEYAVKIALRFYEEVTDVCVSSLQFDGEEYVVADTAGAFPKLTPEKPMVMWLSFPGDMSCYGLYFTDSSGVVCRYIISLSGRNGLVVLTEADD